MSIHLLDGADDESVSARFVRPHDLKVNQLKVAAKYTLADWSSNNNLVTNQSQLHRASVCKLNQDLRRSREDITSQIRWATHTTKSQLSSRCDELSLWQTQASDSIKRLDQEITDLEQVRAAAELCVQEKIMYRQVLGECVVLRDSRRWSDLVQDHVEVELKKEVQLTEEIKELVQKRIYVMLDKLRSLREIRTQLQVDYHDKGEAFKLNTECMTHDLKSPNVAYRCQSSQIAKGTLSYDQWLSHCEGLKQTAERQVLDCSHFRGNMNYTLAKLMNSLESQRCTTDDSLRRRLHVMTRAKDILEWEREQVNDSIKEQVEEMRKVEAQIMSSGTEMQLAHTRLDILKQRPSFELCLDQPHLSLLLETRNLEDDSFGLRKNFQLSQRALESMYRNLSTLEDHLANKAHAMDVDQRCQELRQRLFPLRGTVMVAAEEPEPRQTPGRSHPSTSSFQ